MNKSQEPRLHETYKKEILPDFSHTVDGQWVDFSKINAAVKSYIGKNLGVNPMMVNLNFQPLSEKVFCVESNSLCESIPFKSIVLRDAGAVWTNGKLCLEFCWKYTERSGRVIKGDNFCRLEIDRTGNIIKESIF